MAKAKTAQYYEAVGRRKSAVARVRLYVPGKDKTVSVQGSSIKQGQIYVNKKPIEQTFGATHEKAYFLIPLRTTESEARFAVSIIVRGGGKRGQLEAISHGLARALEKVDKEAYRPLLKAADLLTRDPRTRERRKVGTGGKARRQKQSPKR